MKLTAPILALSALVFSSSAALAGINSSTHSRGPVRSCEDLEITFDDRPAVLATETHALSGSAFSYNAPENGGVWVYTEDRADLSVTVCRAVAKPETFTSIAVVLRGSRIEIGGPSREDWVAHVIVRAPRNAHLDLATSNGPISVRGLAGTLQAATRNGPISVKDCTGQVEARAQNGPISIVESPGRIDAEAINGPVHIKGSAGIVRARSQNGPVSVEASGTDWDGEVDASTTNGPVSLDLPEAFTGTAVVRSNGNSTMKCRHAACRDGGARLWDEDGDPRIQIGSGNPVIRLSTGNGPVTVGSAKG